VNRRVGTTVVCGCRTGAHEALAVDAAGNSEVVASLPSFPSCIDFLGDGRLPMVSANDGRLLRREPDGLLTTYADLSGLADHPWNEVVVDGRDNAYVNNIGFDFPNGEPAPGTIALVTPDGAARQVAGGLWFPNGMAVTPDNATLLVAVSHAHKLTAFDVAANGSLLHRRSWTELGDGVPDGICAWMPMARSGTATSPTSARCAYAREAWCSTRSSSTAAASPAHWAVPTGAPCSWSPPNGRPP